ncbi:hypothetical protein LZ24_01394 [Desulfobotulus alkaliphilus]|uniref:Uncharacterized protein n=1 Tax=Desulfobotulus alkaliphilus TaxID=622671 RepID=A0A562RVY3_9BACT|nr:hypothetical protein [Desulfobotulus alkaliphilus]TWI72983.1 hypothetical protein LZ24_01394 [Desulfobotulus alkaliphilus]
MNEVKDLIYLDMDKVSSLYSQITGGIIQQFETSTSSNKTDKNLRNYDLKLFKHEAGGVGTDSESFKETRVSHHELYNELEDQLFKLGYAAEIGVDVSKEQLASGEAISIFENTLCIKATGWAVLEDYERICRISANYKDIVALINRSIESSLRESDECKEILEKIESQRNEIRLMKNGQQKTKRKNELDELERHVELLIKAKSIGEVEDWIIEGMQNWIRVFLPGVINFRLYPFDDISEFHILSNLKRESFLESSTESVHFLYGSKPTVKLDILGVITAIPKEGSKQFDPMVEFNEEELNQEGRESESVERAFRGVFRGFDGFEEMIRTCRYPRIMIHPIAIYRSIKPNAALQRTSR